MENTKEVARAKRICQETAGKIHDIVEETLWTEFGLLPDLCDKLVNQIREYKFLEQTTQEKADQVL